MVCRSYADRPVGGCRQRARRSANDSAKLACIQRPLRSRLRFNSGNCLRRLHAWLHRHIPILRNCGLRNRLVLPSVDRTRLLLSASLHVGIQRSLQSVDWWMGIRVGLQHAIRQREHRLEEQLLPLSPILGRWRMVGAGRLSPDLSSAAGLSTAVPSAAKCDADPADRASWESELRESAGQAGASWKAVALHSR